MSRPLSLALIQSPPDKVHVPAYDPGALSSGIVHFGVGNFHRAHQALYLDRLFDLGANHDWAITGAGILASDAAMRDTLKAQDWLTTVVERDAFGQTARISASMTDFVAIGDAGALLARMTDPRIRIVSMTITEGGYYLDSATGHFDAGHPDIIADAEALDAPRTVFGFIASALKRRREAGIAPFTVLSCDNIPGNGHVAREVVAGLAKLADPDLAQWIVDEVAFPNSMVDRITPATGEAERRLVAEDFGIADAWPVTCETFTQWVIEDHFPSGRPALEKVGVTFVEDVEPFELMKLRILNGGHAAIAYPAGLMDIVSVSEAMQNDLITAYLDKLETEEIIPAVPPVPDTDLGAYYAKIVERFANPTVGDTIRRLCLDGSNRQPKFILPTARDRVARNETVTGLALVSALWCRYCAGVTDSGAEIAPNDPSWDRLQERAKAARTDPAEFLGMTDIFGELANAPAYVQSFSKALNSAWEAGTKATLERYLADTL